MRGFYFITGGGLSLKGNISDVKNALRAGVKFVQYRAKHLNTIQMYEEALQLRKICRDVKFIINDRVDLALAVNADGVHIGQDDLPFAIARRLMGKRKIIGVTVHSVCEARQARRLGADYLGVSPIFKTSTKEDAGRPIGIIELKKIRKAVAVPLIAIGGIDLSNAEEVIDAGADGLCAISSVVRRRDVKAEIEKFQKLF